MDVLQIFIILFGSGIILGILKMIFDLGVFNNRFKTLEDKFDKLEKTISPVTGCIQKLNHAVIEIQSCLHETAKFEFKHNIDILSQTMSPIVLKNELRPLVHDSGLDKLIEEKKTKILTWLKSQKPPTGMDAQDKIIRFVLSDEIEKYINLKKYKQYMYLQGKSSTDAYAIMALYLFEILIPELNIPKEGKNEKNKSLHKK